MHETEHVDPDTSRAAVAWRDAKAIRSVSVTQSHDAEKCIFQWNPSQPNALLELDEGIRKFWESHGERFSRLWRSVPMECRRNLFLAIYPELEQLPDEKQALAPEIASLDRLSADADALLDLVSQQALEYSLKEHYRRDLRRIHQEVEEGALRLDTSKEDIIALIEGGSFVGEPLQVDRKRLASVDSSLATRFKDMIDDGVAIEGPAFALVMDRRQMIYTIVALILDETRAQIFLPNDKMVCAGLFCTARNFIDERGKIAGPLRSCQRCRRVAYCSRDCQAGNWKILHKLQCQDWCREIGVSSP